MTFGLLPQAAIDRFLRSVHTPARLLVAISGGSDSTGLLVLLHAALKTGAFADISLFAVTVDHGLRRESAGEARDVAGLCRTLGIPHRTRLWAGDKPSHGLAAAARAARYALLCDAADELAATAILAAHTLDDQIETVAMRAERNAGVANVGLSGMAPAVLLLRRHWLLRPLLACRRADLRAALRSAGIGWAEDPSNSDPAYERPRMRARLQAGAGVVSPADIAAAADRRTRLSQAAADVLSGHLTVHARVLAQIDRDALAAVPDDVARTALSHIAAAIGGRPYGLSPIQTERIAGFLRAGAPGCITVGRVAFDLRRDRLFLMRENRDGLPLRLPAGAAGVWDGRFTYANCGTGPVSIAAAGGEGDDLAAGLFAGLPPGAAKRAARSMPVVRAEPGRGDAQQPACRSEAFLGLYDRFLPLFDCKLANVLALAFGRCAYLPPVHDLLTENAG